MYILYNIQINVLHVLPIPIAVQTHILPRLMDWIMKNLSTKAVATATLQLPVAAKVVTVTLMSAAIDSEAVTVTNTPPTWWRHNINPLSAFLGAVSISESRSRENASFDYRIALKFDRHFGSIAAEVPVKFQWDRTMLNTNHAASRLCEILQ